MTDTVEGLRRAAPRTIEFRFPCSVDPQVFATIAGVRVLDSDDGHITLSLRGPVAPVLRVAAALDPLDVIARRADLDELFLDYYRNDAPQEPERAR